MGIMGKIAKFFGIIKVRTINNQVRVTGIDALIMKKYIRSVFETDVINKMMFTHMGDTSFTFHHFFIPDIVYILTKVRMNPKCKWAVRNSIDKIMQGILTETWFKSTVGEVTPMVDPKRMTVLKWPPLPRQAEFLHLYGDRMPRYDLRGYILALAPGQGKAQPLDSMVLTDKGWLAMGDVTLDTKAIAPDGSVVKVTGIYPQGEKDIYRIKFEDGRWTECCEEHLWKIYNKDWGRRGDPWKIMNLADLKQNLSLKSYANRLYVPLPTPHDKPDVDLPIDPYVLGIIIGDGCVGERFVNISTSDQFIVDEITRLIPDDSELVYRSGVDYAIVKKSRICRWKKSQIMESLESLKMLNLRSYEKTIPPIYLSGSISQKISLLQGLMDSDGTVDSGKGDVGGSLSFSTTSELLALQVQDIVRSLGGIAKIKSRVTNYTHKGEFKQGRVSYKVAIRISDPHRLFRLPRKLARVPSNYQYSDNLKLRIRDIYYVGKKPAQCISVDHPDHLYITDDYIVTHNTFTDLLVASCVIPPSVAEVKIIISPKKALHLVWAKSIRDLFKKVPSYWTSDSGTEMPLKNNEYYIFNYESLPKAMELVKKLDARNVRYFVIVDESHNFADPKSSRTQQLVDLQTYRDDTYFIWTTGTPILKLGTELISFLKCADKRFDAEAERRFKKIFASSKGRANEIFNNRLGQMMAFMVPKSDNNATRPTVKELPIKLPSSLSNRFLMATVRKDMKSFIEERIKFYQKDMNNLRQIVNDQLNYHKAHLNTKEEEKAFNTYLKHLKVISRNPDLMLQEPLEYTRKYERTKLLPSLIPTERKSFKSALSAIKNIKLKVRGEALGKILAKRRSECTAALALYCKPEDILKDSLSKTLFFSTSVYPVETLAKFLENKGFQPVRVFGDANKNLTKLIDDFHKDPNLNPICATMQSLSEAVPVTAASTVVLLNRPFRQSMYEQVVARADRMGQIHPVTVIELTLDTQGEPNVSSRTDEILAEVRMLISELVGVEFAGPDMEEREYLPIINAAEQDPSLVKIDELMGL